MFRHTSHLHYWKRLIASISLIGLICMHFQGIPLAIEKAYATTWMDGLWTKRITLTVQSGQVDADLTDFPVYVDLSELPSSFFSSVKSDGGDIRITKSDGVTEVPIDIVAIDTSGETGELHFKADGTLSSSSNTAFYLYYANSSASLRSSDATYGSENVWTDYAGVWHLNEDGNTTANGYNDATSNNNDGTGVSMTSSSDVTGKLGTAQDFDGASDYINVGDDTSLEPSSTITVSAWAKITGDGSHSDGNWVVTKGRQFGGVYSTYGIGYRPSDDKIGSFVRSSGIPTEFSTATYTPVTDWLFIGMTYDGSNTIQYIDGAQETSAARTGNLSYGLSDDDMHIGDWALSSYTRRFEGEIDEVRIATVARSADWMSTEYNNQNSPSTFMSVGTEETGSDSTNPTLSSSVPADDATGVETNANITLTFSEAVDPESGNITIKKASNNSTVEIIDVSGGQVTGGGTTSITINPSSTLSASTEYYVLIDATAFDDLAGNSYAGISSTSALSFTTGSVASWMNASWSNRVKITVQSGQVDADLTDFPVYVDLSELPSSFFSTVQSDGDDIRVTKNDGTTEVPVDIVAIDTGSSTGEVHFKADGTLSSSANTVFYLYYGSGSAARPAASATYGSENVWTDYAGVWHLNEDGNTTANGYNDATSNNNDGTGVSMTSSSDVTGKLGTAQDFDGASDYINVGDDTSLEPSSTITVSAWAKVTGNGSHSDGNWVVTKGRQFGGVYSTYGIGQRPSDDKILSFARPSGLALESSSTTYAPVTNWLFISMTYDGSNTIQYVDGAQETSAARTGNLSYGLSDDDMHIGDWALSSYTRRFEGQIDEVRVATVARSADWISTEYNNQNSPSTFMSVGFEESSGDTVNPTISSLSPADGATSVSTGANLVVTFDEAVDAYSGNVVIYTNTGGVFETIDVTSGNVSGSGTTTITINPTGTLTAGTGYYVQIDATAFDDLAGNSFAGIADTSTWNFTTAASASPPTISSTDPADNETGVGVNYNPIITFNEAVRGVTGNVVVHLTSDDSTVETIDVTGGRVSGSGTTTITVDPSTTFSDGIEYYILIDAGAFEDLDGNDHAGISSTTQWSFTTSSTPVISSNPSGSDGVELASDGTDVTVTGQSGTQTIRLVDNSEPAVDADFAFDSGNRDFSNVTIERDDTNRTLLVNNLDGHTGVVDDSMVAYVKKESGDTQLRLCSGKTTAGCTSSDSWSALWDDTGSVVSTNGGFDTSPYTVTLDTINGQSVWKISGDFGGSFQANVNGGGGGGAISVPDLSVLGAIACSGIVFWRSRKRKLVK